MKRWMKRRAAVEPIIGHLKADNRLDRTIWKGEAGNRLNPILVCRCLQPAQIAGVVVFLAYEVECGKWRILFFRGDDVLGDDLDCGLRLLLADGGDLQGLLLGGGIPTAIARCPRPHPAEANQGDSQSSDGKPAVRPRNHAHDASPKRHRPVFGFSPCSQPAAQPRVGGACSLSWKKAPAQQLGAGPGVARRSVS